MLRLGYFSKIGLSRISTTFPAAGQILSHRKYCEKIPDKKSINLIIEEVKKSVHKLESEIEAGKQKYSANSSAATSWLTDLQQNFNALRNGIDEQFKCLIEHLENGMDQKQQSSFEELKEQMQANYDDLFAELEKRIEQKHKGLSEEIEKRVDAKLKGSIEQLEKRMHENHKSSIGELNEKMIEMHQSSIEDMNEEIQNIYKILLDVMDQKHRGLIEEIKKREKLNGSIEEMQKGIAAKQTSIEILETRMDQKYKFLIEQMKKQMEQKHENSIERMQNGIDEKYKSLIEQLEKRMGLKQKGFAGLLENPIDEKQKGSIEEMKNSDEKNGIPNDGFGKRVRDGRTQLIYYVGRWTVYKIFICCLFMLTALQYLAGYYLRPVFEKMYKQFASRQLEAAISNFSFAKNNKWTVNRDYLQPNLIMGSDGLTLTHSGKNDRPITVRAELPITKTSLNKADGFKIVGYYETKILKNRFDVAIGFCDSEYPLDKQLGTSRNSIALRGGKFLVGGYSFDTALKTFTDDDLIGIYLVTMAGHLMCYAICNGALIGMTVLPSHFANLNLFPAVSLCSKGTSIKANFGLEHFDLMMKKELKLPTIMMEN